MPEDAPRNGVQLITYADRLGGTLPGLKDLLDGPLRGVFEGVHILPFFTPFDGADAGFDPVDHTEVDPRLGTWDDVRAIGAGPRADGRHDREPRLRGLPGVPRRGRRAGPRPRTWGCS